MKVKAIIIGIVGLLTGSAHAGTPINIWDGTTCSASVKLTPYLVDGADNTACIVCPGGSYFWLDVETEGIGVAKWLNENGISAFVLQYRVAGVPAFITHYRLLGGGNRYPYMLQDVQRSIQLIRENSKDYGINPDKVGVMGFSAGGHLTIMAGEFFGTNTIEAMGIECATSLRPDFIAPIYPVVSMRADCTHKRSRRALLGDNNASNQTMRDSLSLEDHVRVDMPPVFLVNCVDDPIVKYHNSELLDSAPTVHNVNHLYTQFKTGGHGFGATDKKTTAEARTWKEKFITWINRIL